MKPTTSLDPVVLEQLKLDATKYAARNNVSWAHREWLNCEADYLAGAIAEREKAMELVEALENIQAQSKFYLVPEELPAFKVCADLAKDAVEKYLGKAKE